MLVRFLGKGWSEGRYWLSSDGDDRIGTNIKTKKNPRHPTKPKISLDQRLTPKKFHAESPNLKITRKDCSLFAQLRSRDARVLPLGI